MNKSQKRRMLKADREKSGLCVYCGLREPKEQSKGCEDCLKKKSKKTCESSKNNPNRVRAYNHNVKIKVIEKYGGKCACCNETNICFLSIDHKNNNGGAERQNLYGNKYGNTKSWYLKLKREEKRADLQVLCFNCNMAKAFYGKCPHEENFSPIDLSVLNEDGRRKGNFGICCKINWPTDEQLIDMIRSSNCMIVAKELGVHNTAIRGRLKRRNLYHLVNQREQEKIDKTQF